MTSDYLLSEVRRTTLKDVLAPFAAKIDRVGLFGSHATGRARVNSDIDIVIYGSLDANDVDRLWTLLNDCALPVPVDVVAYNLPVYPPLRAHIDRVSKPLFSADQLVVPGPA